MKAYAITQKGQVTIPLEIRKRMKLRPGDRVAYEETEQGIILKPLRKTMLEDFGFLKGRPTATGNLEVIRQTIRKKIGVRSRGQ